MRKFWVYRCRDVCVSIFSSWSVHILSPILGAKWSKVWYFGNYLPKNALTKKNVETKVVEYLKMNIFTSLTFFLKRSWGRARALWKKKYFWKSLIDQINSESSADSHFVVFFLPGSSLFLIWEGGGVKELRFSKNIIPRCWKTRKIGPQKRRASKNKYFCFTFFLDGHETELWRIEKKKGRVKILVEINNSHFCESDI